MVLEINRQIVFRLPIYEPPNSHPYNSMLMIERAVYLSDHKIFENSAPDIFALLKKATEGSKPLPIEEQVGTEVWENPNALINRIIRVEETRITNVASWQKFKRILQNII